MKSDERQVKNIIKTKPMHPHRLARFHQPVPANKCLITCRIAATDYTFEKFTYVEMADFTPEQVQVFARKWFARDEAKAKRFVTN